MRGLLIAIGLLTAPFGAFALTWDFDDGTTWGWTAQESSLSIAVGSSYTTVYSEVEDGVWRIAPVPDAQRPALLLRSPPIGEDSALFDSVTLRLRIIHDRPTEGNLLMWWFNSEYKRFTDAGIRQPDRFSMGRLQIYLTEWQDITIDLRALEAAAAANPAAEITWQNTLFDFQLDLDLNTHPQSSADHPEFLEIDWIRLTGVEERLLGELQPRKIAVEAGLPGALFATPDFFPLGAGVEIEMGPQTLGDIDGDGDVDLVAAWSRSTGNVGPEHWGWTVAFNNGRGEFVSVRERQVGPTTGSPRIQGGDFDGDGLLDLAVTEGASAELLHNQGKDGFETVLQLFDAVLFGLADGDGDGDVDLLVHEFDDESSHIVLWRNDGAAGFVRSDRFVLDTEERLFPQLLAGQPLGEAVRLLWTRPCYLPQGAWQLTRPWEASEEPPLFLDAVVNPCDLHLLIDLNGDGDVGLIGSSERNLQFDPTTINATRYGLSLWRLDASGEVERHILLHSQVRIPDGAGAIASDLTGDGLLDVAVVDGNLATGPALVVLTGQRAGLPVVEGRYRLPGTGGPVLAGDFNGDGATDLVVLGRSVEGGPGGAFVFLNQNTPATAIAAETTTTPSAFVLGANYPNPFNPATTIPLALPAGAEEVDLTIYNVLGQPVRRVWAGSLAAGEHRLAWDGRDAQGQPVAAGVYWYRLQVDDQTSTRKMVKIE